MDVVPVVFRRHEPDPHKTYDGIGLGLGIAKSMVEPHDGDLLIVSALAKGTTMSVVLPRHADEARGHS